MFSDLNKLLLILQGSACCSFRLYGTRVAIDWSVSILFMLIVLSTGSILTGTFAFLVVMASVLLHEFGHVAAARRYGYGCRDIRMNLFGGIAFIDTNNATPMQEVVIAACGPLVNLSIFLLLLPPFLLFGWAGWTGVTEVLAIVLIIQAVMFLFNLTILAPPADGGRIVRGVISMATNSLRPSLPFLWATSALSLCLWLLLVPSAILPIVFIAVVSVYENMRYASSIFGHTETVGQLCSAPPMGGSHALVEDGKGCYAVLPVATVIDRMNSVRTRAEADFLAGSRLIDFALRNSCRLRKIRPERRNHERKS